MNEPGYDAVIPAPVRYHPRLTANEKLLYGEIRALTRKEGYCWANNRYFRELYNVETPTVSAWISNLRRAGFIRVEIDKAAGNERKIWIIPIQNNLNTYSEKSEDPIQNKPKPLYIEKEDKSNKDVGVFVGMDEKALLEEAALSIFKLYPAKTPKAPAIRAIKKALKKNKAEFLREKTLQYAAVRGGDLEFVPHASTWFNQERFADEPETWKPKNTNGTNTNSKTNARSAKRSHAADSGTDKIAHLY